MSARRNRRIARNQFCHGATVRFNPQRKRRHIEQQHVFHAAIQNIGLHCRAQSHHFIGVQLRVRLAVKEFLHRTANQRRSRGAADKHHFANVRRLQLRVGQRLLHRTHGAVDDGTNQRVQRASRELVRKDLSVRQRKAQRRRLGLGQLMLHLDQRLAKLLRQLAVRRKINLVVLKNQFVDKSLKQIVDVVAAQVRVAVGRQNLVDVALARRNKFEDGNIEGSTTKIVDCNFAALLLVQAISKRRSRGLVDEAQNFEARNPPSVFSGLALRIVEVSRHGNDSAVDCFAEKRFGPILQFA